jgi:phosphate transport system protein
MTAQPQKRNGADLARGHRVHAYDQELARLSDLVLEMGRQVVTQTQAAISSLLEEDLNPAYRVLDRESQIDYLSLDVDEEVFRLITRRQPAAIDLRIVMALSRVAGMAERAADKAARIAHNTLDYRTDDTPVPTPLEATLSAECALACSAFEHSIAALAEFDINLALGVFEDEPALIQASHTTRMTLLEQTEVQLPPVKLASLLLIAHSLESIGRHASAIAEQVIYVVDGTDVRYRNREILIETLRHHHS